MRIAKPQAEVGKAPDHDLALDLETCIARYAAAAPNKSLATADGWTYLINDSNDWLRWHFGLKRWSAEQLAQVQAMYARRVAAVQALGARYIQFITPEKSIIYPQYMPGLLKFAPAYERRPAMLLHQDENVPVYYMQDVLREYSKICLTYFRGDSHPSFFGSFLIYQAMHATLAEQMPLTPALSYDQLVPRVATFGGDLFGQLAPEQREQPPKLFQVVRPRTGSEPLLNLVKDRQTASAEPAPVAHEYKSWFRSRESFVWQNRDRSLPRCVVFRDSTATFVLDFLAEHFSRMVAIWYGGRIVEEVITREKPDIVIHIQAERLLSPADKVEPMYRLPAGPGQPPLPAVPRG